MTPVQAPNGAGRGRSPAPVRLGVVFPGQGSQFAGMADPWLGHPASRAALEEASDLLGFDVAAASRDESALERTELVQPALLACDVAAFRVLEAEGAEPAAVAGHSLGEFAALVAAGVLRFRDAVEVVQARAEATGRAARERPGAMSALVGLSASDAAEVCATAGRGDVLTVANENGPRQAVVSGSVAAVERAEELARTRGARPVRLRVAGAFHSPLMAPALPAVRAALARVEVAPARFPVVANVTGRATTHPSVLRDLLGRQVVSPVRWERSMRTMADLGVELLVEAGPGDVLAKLAKRAAPGVRAAAATSPQEVRGILGRSTAEAVPT